MALLRRLGLAPSWVPRPALVDGLPYSEAVVDDELADLVIAQLVMFNARGQQYRLAGAVVARAALRQLLAQPELAHMVVGRQSTLDPRLYRFGVARRTVDAAGAPLMLMYELELPYLGPAGLLQLQQQMQATLATAAPQH